MRSARDYADQLARLLPPGRAWPREPDSILGRVLRGLAEEFARVDGRALALLDEADPSTALELLPDWERVAGLPDPCRPIPDSIRERQRSVAAKVAGLGGQTPAYLVQLAATAGYEVSILEFTPFVAGSDAGDECCNDSWRHAFLVEVQGVLEVNIFRAGSLAGERLRSWGANDLECLISRAAPAHSHPLYAFVSLEPEPALWFEFLMN